MTFAISARRNRKLLLFCSLVLLFLRIGGVHLHLCLDGQESFATLHVQDSGLEHADSGASGHHHDENIDDGAASLVKSFTADFDVPPILLAAFALWAVLPPLRMPRVRNSRIPPFRVPAFLRPPLRGPPVTTIS